MLLSGLVVRRDYDAIRTGASNHHIQVRGTVITLKLIAGAVKFRLCEVASVLVLGTTMFGALGVLLVVADGPISCTSVPDDLTADGSEKTSDDVLVPPLATLMMSVLAVLLLTTLQKTVSLVDARVLGRYSSPRLRENSYERIR